ncbi:histidine kinase, partial [Paraburkholderia strydomiana]
MPVSGKTPTPHTAVPHERSNWFAARPALAAAAVFVAALAVMLAARRWLDPVLFICVAAALLVATSAFMLLRARREASSARSEASV